MVVVYLVIISNTVTYFFVNCIIYNLLIYQYLPFYTNLKCSRAKSSQSSALNNTTLSVLCLGVQQSCVIQHIQRIQTFTCYKQSVLKHPPGQSVIITGVRPFYYTRGEPRKPIALVFS